MTQQQTHQQQEDPFAPSESRPSVSFKNAPLGTSYQLEVTSIPTMVQARDFDTRELEFWPDGNKKLTVVTNVVDKATGEEKSLWAPKPSGMFAAIQAAQQAADAQIQPGGTLIVTFAHEVPVEGKPHLNPAKRFAVQYLPPNAFGEAQGPPPQWAQPPAATPPPTAPPVQHQTPPAAPPAQQLPVAPPVQYAPPPGAPAATPPAATPPVAPPPVQQAPYSAEQVAALLAANIDPRTVYPTYDGRHGWHTV